MIILIAFVCVGLILMVIGLISETDGPYIVGFVLAIANLIAGVAVLIFRFISGVNA